MKHPHIRTPRTTCLPALLKAGNACLRAFPASRVSSRVPSCSCIRRTDQYDKQNRLTAIKDALGSTRTQDSDGFARLSRIRVKSPSQVSLMQRGYTYDAESNITAIATEQGDNQYQYDALYRLTNVTTGIGGLPGEQYTYDSLGNRLTDKRRPNPNQGDKSWRYNGNNQLLESATEDSGILFSNSKAVTHSYDANGSLLQKTTPAGSQGQYPTDNQKYHYDAQNRLTEVQDQNGNTIASTQYDPLGRRIRKTIHRSWDGSAWTALAQNETHTYFYADEGLAAEYQAEGNNAPQLISQVGWQPDGLWGTNPVWIKTIKQGASQAEFFYYQNDHLGTPQTIIDGQGQVVWRMKATAFGETSVDPASMIANNLRFPGQYYDSETNTHYNYFRDYNPEVGRYVQSDPIGLDGGINYYWYVEGNPLSLIDPKGLAGQRPNSTITGLHSPILFPPLWEPNGNIQPGYEDQDWECSSIARPLNRDKCSKQCCIKHDACYKANRCNFTSWGGNKLGLSLACQKCNSDAVLCIKENFGKKECGSDCQ